MKANHRLAWAALLLVGGCVSVRGAQAPGANLGQLRTFSFRQTPENDAKQAQFERSVAGQTIRNQIALNLRERGLVEAPPGQADFEVAYHQKMQEYITVSDWGYGAWGWGWGGWWGSPLVTEYTEGTIVVDFIEPRSGSVLWRGTASQVINHPNNPKPAKMAKAVDKMFRKAPPPTLTATGGAPTRM